MIVNVHIKEKTIPVKCGPATQNVLWLAHVALTRYSPKKTNFGLKLGIPSAIQRDNGEIINPEAIIKDSVEEEEHIWVVLGDEQVQSRLPQKQTSSEDEELKFVYEELYNAIKSGDISQVKRLIEKENVPPNEMINDQRPIHVACTNSQLAIVKYLIETHNVDPNEQDGYERTPLLLALENGDLLLLKYLLEEQNISPDQEIGLDRLLPISFAAKYQGNSEIAFEMVKYFVERWGIDPNSKDPTSTSPIYWTLAENIVNEEAAIYLLEKGVPANQVLAPTNETVLELSARRHSKAIIEKILRMKNNGIENRHIDSAIELATGDAALQKLLSDSK